MPQRGERAATGPQPPSAPSRILRSQARSARPWAAVRRSGREQRSWRRARAPWMARVNTPLTPVSRRKEQPNHREYRSFTRLRGKWRQPKGGNVDQRAPVWPPSAFDAFPRFAEGGTTETLQVPAFRQLREGRGKSKRCKHWSFPRLRGKWRQPKGGEVNAQVLQFTPVCTSQVSAATAVAQSRRRAPAGARVRPARPIHRSCGCLRCTVRFRRPRRRGAR